MSQNTNTSPIKVYRNQLDKIYKVEVHGGGKVESRYELVSSAINAIQDFMMGIYEQPEVGLHLKVIRTSEEYDNGISSIIGAVGIYYQGVELNRPEKGWAPVEEIDGYMSITGFKNDEHRGATIRKHAFLHRLFNNIGFTISIGSGLSAKMEAALRKVQSRDLEARKTGIRGHVANQIIWNRVDKTAELPTSIIVSTTAGDPFDLFKADAGAVFALVNYAGKELTSTRWNPGNENNIRWWEKFAESGGKVTSRVA